MSTVESAVRIQSLSYVYPDGTHALNGVSLDIAVGERVGLIGANGAGKSTLLLHLNGIHQGEGQVAIMTLPIEKRNLSTVRQKVGMVFQNPDDQLFCPTVYDDVAFGPRNLGLSEGDVAARVAKSLAGVGMTGFENKPAFHLSLGQKKRVALATVLSMEAELLVLDEPTSNLDPKGRNEIIHLLQTLIDTQIIATHDLDLVAKLCTRVILLSKGRCVADGPPSEIVENRKLLELHGLC
jgi:cobalt transport protein ATP-binding subunit